MGFVHAVSGLTGALLAFFDAHEFWALFLLIGVEEAGLPLTPPDYTLVMLAGARPHASGWETLAALGVSSLAAFLGSSALYALGRRGGRPLLHRYGTYLSLTPRRVERLERWFLKSARVAVLVGRLFPGLRIGTSAVAGLLGVPYAVFAPVDALAAVLWVLLYYWLGALIQPWLAGLGAGALAALAWLVAHPAGAIPLAALVAAVACALWRIRRVRRLRATNATPDARELGSARPSAFVD